MKVDTNLQNSNKSICENINDIKLLGRWKSSINILNLLRNLVDSIIVKVKNGWNNVDMSHQEMRESVRFVKENTQYKIIRDFHRLLQVSSSHYTNDEFGSETLILKYLEHLYKIRKFVKHELNLEILINLEEFPYNLDELSKGYYRQIIEWIWKPTIEPLKKDKYYIVKKKPIILEWNILYEITFTWLSDKLNKSDRFIGFTNIDIFDNYAVELILAKQNIKVFGKDIQVFYITNYNISVRPAELMNLAKVFGNSDLKIRRWDINYNIIMDYIKEYWLSLVDILWDDSLYGLLKNRIRTDLQSYSILEVFKNARSFVINQKPWSNIIRYLLFILNNRIIKDQKFDQPCYKLSNLHLYIWVKLFDDIPFIFSPIWHNPRFSDLIQCIDSSDKEDEFLARYLKNNAETGWKLYTLSWDLEDKFDNLDNLIQAYYNKLYYKKECIVKEQKMLYIKSYEENVIDIINKMWELSSSWLQNYSSFSKKRVDELALNIDDPNKEKVLSQLFLNSKIAFIYWSAWTWKTRLIEYISWIFSDHDKLYITQTLTALDNLERRIKYENKSFLTSTKAKIWNYKCDILFIDESSTISNRDMREILCSWNIEYEYLIFVWDTYQIESIQFGNWFSIAEYVFPSISYYLDNTRRTNDQSLLKLWTKTRELDESLITYISQWNYWCELNEQIFEKYSDDEIILCLNYDGIYGINSINNYMQTNNEQAGIEIRNKLYKVDDPIVFNDLANNRYRFWYAVYNNLKWRIVKISDEKDYIDFYIGLYISLTPLDIWWDVELVDEQYGIFDSIIKFPVYKKKQTQWEDDDDESSATHIVPFDIAYAMSIHKAQWLEYESVKIVITDEIEERVTHNIFYTAITRAKINLQIYSSPEVLNNIISNMSLINSKADANILKNKI